MMRITQLPSEKSKIPVVDEPEWCRRSVTSARRRCVEGGYDVFAAVERADAHVALAASAETAPGVQTTPARMSSRSKNSHESRRH